MVEYCQCLEKHNKSEKYLQILFMRWMAVPLLRMPTNRMCRIVRELNIVGSNQSRIYVHIFLFALLFSAPYSFENVKFDGWRDAKDSLKCKVQLNQALENENLFAFAFHSIWRRKLFSCAFRLIFLLFCWKALCPMVASHYQCVGHAFDAFKIYQNRFECIILFSLSRGAVRASIRIRRTKHRNEWII